VTISMLSGMIEPTSGDAVMYGMSVQEQMEELYGVIGICPQHNVLYPLLTVREHLVLFARVKGVPLKDVNAAVTVMLEDIGLTEKQHSVVKSLSGGMKRRLQLGMALIGGSKVVFADEPTSGVDPVSRRHLWDLLIKYKKDRVIILTTHFMDEADAVGDRIGIMSKGKMVCCGTPLFLKENYGVGYVLTIEKKDSCTADVSRSIRDFVSTSIPGSEVLSDAAKELSFRLPFASSSSFPSCFHELESEEKFEVESYGLSVTTVEEVFLKVADTHDSDIPEEKISDESLHALDAMLSKMEYAKNALWFNWDHIKALFLKRYRSSRRNRNFVLCSLIYPFVLFNILCLFLRLGIPSNFSSRELSVDLYDDPDRIFVTTGTTFASFIDPPSVPVFSPANDATSMSTELLNSIGNFKETRYGAFAVQPDVAVVLFNTTATDSLPVYLNVLHSSLLSQLSGVPSASIVVSNNPFPLTRQESTLNNAFYCVFIAIAISFVPSALASIVILERESGAKHLQQLSGVSMFSYWFSAFLWDFLIYCITSVSLIIVLFIWNVSSFTSFEAVMATALLFLLFGLAIIPWTYLLSFLFKNEGSGQNMILFINVILGAVLVLIFLVTQIVDSIQSAADYIVWSLRIFPGFSFGHGLMGLAVRDSRLVFSAPRAPWDFEVIGWSSIFLVVNIFLSTLGLYLVERNLFLSSLERGHFSAKAAMDAEDEDVAMERTRVESGKADTETIVTKKLCRTFSVPGRSDPFVALNDLSLGIPSGQIFGLLGANGAGKTTTVNILTTFNLPTAGDAIINGHDVVSERDSVRKSLGYCPQFDALIDTLTVRDHLELYSSIKGASVAQRAELVKLLMEAAGITLYENALTKTLSGGTKRKLSVAIALIGSPAAIILDEPSVS